ncbi:MAG TPA: 5'/3'-nucleotidase SurE [Flavobacteriales bacterium]|nr:5'/3'-nucleotidase SurE [Flavobacteriales bacterium]HPH82689.1 5'/3'-nucleotidase SurE [Flavobacteriales bacterium]
MSERKLILVCNDDGITAPGIRALVAVAKEFGDVVVVAPDKPQSAMGHAITINATIRVNPVKVDGVIEYACSGTPVDCVKLAVNKILHRKPDLLVSGINHGSNASINVIYSGTMSAAMEGAMEQIPSIGFSLLDHSIDADFSAAQDVARILIAQALENEMPDRICLNVNIPNVSKELIKGIKVCRQAIANWEEEFEERKDPSGKPYFWLTGIFKNYDSGTDTDIWALENNYVSVVPCQFDITAHTTLNHFKSWEQHV